MMFLPEVNFPGSPWIQAGWNWHEVGTSSPFETPGATRSRDYCIAAIWGVQETRRCWRGPIFDLPIFDLGGGEHIFLADMFKTSAGIYIWSLTMRFPPFWKPFGDTGYWGFFVFLTSATPKSHPQHPTKHRKMMRPRTWMIWSLEKELPPFTVVWPG